MKLLRKSAFFFLLTGVFCLVLAQSTQAQVFVEDELGKLSPEEIETLGKSLEAYEASSSHEIALRIVDSLDLSEKSIREYANQLYNTLGIGKKGLDNGILLLWAPKNRKIAIELGYGLEPYITDVQAQYIIDKRMSPYMKEGKYLFAFQNAISFIKVLLKGFGAKTDVYPDSLLIDQFTLLSAQDQERLQAKLEKYQEESGHVVWVRILPHKTNPQTVRVIAKRLFQKLEDKNKKVYQTLIFIGVHKISKDQVFLTNTVNHNWPYLVREILAPDDYYHKIYNKSKSSDVVTYRLESVLGHRFRKDDYYRGIRYAFEYIQKIHQKEIKSDQIKRRGPFWEQGQYGVFIILLIPFVLMLIIGLIYKVTFGRGKGRRYKGSSYRNTFKRSSSSYISPKSNSSGGSSSGGWGSSGGSSSGDGSYGGGDFGGGSSGGGGADGSY